MQNEEIQRILSRYHGLEYDHEGQRFNGLLHLSDTDYYEVIIDVSPFPRLFPDVYEVGERIPQKLDRHKYNDSDKCCLTTRANAQILIKTKIKSITEFFDRVLVPYFKNNSFYEINRYYYQGEYSHDKTGILEGYQDILGIKDPLTIAAMINGRIKGQKLTIRDKCFCGNGLTLKKCSHHLNNYRKFRLVDKDILTEDLMLLIELIEEIKEHFQKKGPLFSAN